jgi:hypothetical protein
VDPLDHHGGGARPCTGYPRVLDANNAFGDLERPCIGAALEANMALHPMIPLYDVLYTRGKGELLFYDELGNEFHP